MEREGRAWLRRVQHDLVKRLLWPARDRQALGGPPIPGELRVALTDDEGQAVSVETLWRSLCEQAPARAPAPALAAFGAALAAAGRAAAADDLAGVLALEPAFAELARNVKESEGPPPPPGAAP